MNITFLEVKMEDYGHPFMCHAGVSAAYFILKLPGNVLLGCALLREFQMMARKHTAKSTKCLLWDSRVVLSKETTWNLIKNWYPVWICSRGQAPVSLESSFWTYIEILCINTPGSRGIPLLRLICSTSIIMCLWFSAFRLFIRSHVI